MIETPYIAKLAHDIGKNLVEAEARRFYESVRSKCSGMVAFDDLPDNMKQMWYADAKRRIQAEQTPGKSLIRW